MREIETLPTLPPEELLNLPTRSSALGRDPFDEIAAPDAFLERLDEIERPDPTHRRDLRPAPAPAARRRRTETRREPAAPTRFPRRRHISTPSLGEIDLPDATGLLERMLGDDERRRLVALTHLVEGEASYDRYGLSPDALRRAFPVFYALYRLYFRVQSQGHEHIPIEGPGLLVSNHGGLLPFDGAMSVIDVLLNTNPTRLARAVVDRWAGTLPWVNVFYARVGQVVGTRENFTDLLDEGQLLMVFPEGMDGARKPVTQRYSLQRFRVGFIEQALRARAPIIPMAVIGSDDQTPILYDVKPLAKWLGLPVAPITPTFPWFGPLGLLPYPVSYRIVYGEPLNYHQRFGPEGADDSRLVRYLANQVRRAVQLLLDRYRG